MEDRQILNEIENINESDNLGLNDIHTNTIPPGIIFPNELNQYLQGQVQFLLHTKGMLERRISENEDSLKDKTKVISKLNAKISEYEQFTKPDSIVSANPVHLMSAKIVELSKRLKDKTVENESLKTKYTKIQQKLNIIEKTKTHFLEKNSEDEDVNEKQEPFVRHNYAEELKTVQDKLSHTTTKLFDVKNRNIELKNEIKSATKILQQELGDSFTSIQNFANNQTNWRGRAQQIIHLQQKNSELQDKIAVLSLNASLATLPPKPDGRKLVIEQLEKDISNVKTELDENKRKLSAAKSRIRVLENENNCMKVKLNAVTQKSENDETEIQSLQAKVQSLQEQNADMDRDKQKQIKKFEDEIKTLKTEVERDNFVIENLQKNIEEKTLKIKELTTEYNMKKRTNSCSSNDSRLSSPSTKIDPNKLQVLEVERKRLLELVDVLNSRLKDERDAHSSTQINFKKERQKAAKLETKLSRLELENSLNSSFSHSYSKSFTKLTATPSTEPASSVTYENLKNSLELAEENVSILKSKLDLVLKEKDNDFQKFSQIISESSSMCLKNNSPELLNTSVVQLN